MFSVENDKTINITRGDSIEFVAPVDYSFQSGDVLRLKVYRKKACEDVVLQKDFTIAEATETVNIVLTEQDTRIGGVISKPVDYWYELEVNPDNNPQTILGYDDDGAKIFRLYPEGRDLEDDEIPKKEFDTLREILSEFKEKEIPSIIQSYVDKNIIPIVVDARVWTLEKDRMYWATGSVIYQKSLMDDMAYYFEGKRLLLVVSEEENTRFYLFLGDVYGMALGIVTGTVNSEGKLVGEVNCIETDKNRVFEIDENSTYDQYPSAKAVYDALLAQAIDIKIEPIGEDVQPTTFAMRSVPMTASEPTALGENVIPLMGLSVVSGGTLVSDVDGVITVTHDGTTGTVIGLQQTSGLGEDHPQVTGDIWYLGAKIAAEKYYWEDGAKSAFPPVQVYVRAADDFKYVASNVRPTTEEATDYFGTFEIGADSVKGFNIIAIRVNYQQAAYVTGRKCIFSDMVLVNLTEAYGKGNEPTADEYHAMLVGSSEGDSGDSGESGGGDIPGGDAGGGDDSGDSGNDNPGGNTPIVSGSGYKLIITTAEGTETLYLYQGQKGEDGKDGTNGKDGKNGVDGISPTINVEEIEGGNRLIITDKNGNQTVDIMNAPPIDTELREDVTNAIGENTSLEDLTDTLKPFEIGGLNASTGAIIIANETNKLDSARSSYPFRVVPGEVYHIWGASNRMYSMIALYDESKEFIASDYVGLENSATKFENVIYTIPETATDKNGNIKNVSYMACATKLVADSGGADICVKREVTKHNNVQSDIASAIEDSAATKLDKVLVSPNGCEWVLTISNDGAIVVVPKRDVSDTVNTTLTMPNNLSAGTYTLKYESADGVLTDYAEICSLEVANTGDVVSYSGLIAENCAPEGATSIGIYNSSNVKVDEIELGFLNTKYSTKLYSFVALSDVHIGNDWEAVDYEAREKAISEGKEYTKEPYLEKFKGLIGAIDDDDDIDFTVICGDMVDKAQVKAQLEDYQSVVEDLKKPVYVTMGNHEMTNAVTNGMTFDDIKDYFVQSKFQNNPDLYFSFSPEDTDDVFIMFGISGSYQKYVALSVEQLNWLQKELEKYRNKRVFLFHHYFPYDGSGDAIDCYNQNGLQGVRGDLFYDLLKHYKNVIYFHGHTHAQFKLQELHPMNTIDDIYGRYSVHIPSAGCPTHPNDDMNGYLEDFNASEGYVIDVYEHGIALRGKDFVNGVFLPIGSYYLDTIPQKIEANSFRDTTGLLNSVGIKKE